MKQNLIYLLKALFFSSLIFTAIFFFLAFLMFQNGWGETIMKTLLYVGVCIATFLGSFYFAKHTSSRRFLWGILYGVVFWAVYVLVAFLLNGAGNFSWDHTLTTLAFAAIAGMAGGMCS